MDRLEKIKAIQAILGVDPDGIFKNKSHAALDMLIHGESTPDTTHPYGASVDPRSEKNIATLHPKVQGLARSLIQEAAAQGMTFKITSGSRTYAEQAALFQAHQSGGPQAAPAGQSNHNFQLAFDVTEFKGSEPVWDSPNYKKVGEIGKSLGLTWGGDWVKSDEPHFELRPSWAKDMSEGNMLAELRRRHDKNIDQFA